MTFRILIEEINEVICATLKTLEFPQVSFVVEPSKPGFGDVSCNVAFLLAKKLKTNPLEIAKKITEKIQEDPPKMR